MNLLILTKNDSLGDDRYRIDDRRANHILKILKLKTGDSLQAGILNGPIGVAHIESFNKQEIIIQCDKMTTVEQPPVTVDLICALPRPQTLKKVLLTSAMMAVRRVYLIRANRVEKSYYQSPLLDEKNYLPYLVEGLSQGKHTRLPKVTIHDRFRPFFEDTFLNNEKSENDSVLKLLPEPECDQSLTTVANKVPSRFIIAIGPEGGWVPFEIDLMKQIGFQTFRLSRSILRVETALAAALAQIELIYSK